MKRKRTENPRKTDRPCPKCHAFLYKRSVHIVWGGCWQCHAPMPIAFGDSGVMMMGPPAFVLREIEIAEKHGARLQQKYSKTTKETYLANSCEKCGAFCGDFFLHDFWYEQPIVPPVEIALGCLECFTAVAVTPEADGTAWTGVIPHDPEETGT